ncbi:MAG: HD family phosphohydrolase [Armatimonadota bacterium]
MSTRAAKRKRSRAQVVWKRWGDWRKMAIALTTGLILAILLTIHVLPDKVPVRAGEVARADVFAPRDVSYLDNNRTQLLRALVANQVKPVHSTVLEAENDARETAERFFSTALSLRGTDDVAPDEAPADAAARDAGRIAALRKRFPDISPEAAKTALTLSDPVFNQARSETFQLVERAMGEPILPAEADEARSAATQRAATLRLPRPARRLVGEAAALSIVPNRFFNESETETARTREMQRVPDQYVTIRRGDLVLRRGETVTQEHMDRLRALNLVRNPLDWFTFSSLLLLAFGLVGLFSLYLYQFHPKILRSFSSLLLISVVVCGSMLLFRIGSTAVGFRVSDDQLGFLGMVCSALGAMLLAALLCPQIAVFVGVALALLTSVQVGEELRFVILSIVSSLVGVQAVTTIRNRAGIIRAGVTLSAVNIVTAFIAHGATRASLPQSGEEIWQITLWGVVGGFSSISLFVLFAAWLERPFRLTTPLTLLELSDPTHPLLRRLSMEAPGTYHHSIIVGNLAEASAEAIGADALFCRVASYYHDIGKIIRPHFFVENQSAENRHNTINPSLSSLVIASHVKDGVELAEEYRLPPPIIAIIREHHGTCLIKYFYHQAVTAAGEENASALEYQFRYEGPRPQTKESGIIMLADSVEAASRTLEKPTPGRIRDLIERIVRDRLSDGQLDDCELTFKDLEKVISSMTRSLTSLLHARIEYPNTDSAGLRRLAADGAADKQPVGPQKALADTPETAAAASRGTPGF